MRTWGFRGRDKKNLRPAAGRVFRSWCGGEVPLFILPVVPFLLAFSRGVHSEPRTDSDCGGFSAM